jgi:hypothetical protein
MSENPAARRITLLTSASPGGATRVRAGLGCDAPDRGGIAARDCGAGCAGRGSGERYGVS